MAFKQGVVLNVIFVVLVNDPTVIIHQSVSFHFGYAFRISSFLLWIFLLVSSFASPLLFYVFVTYLVVVSQTKIDSLQKVVVFAFLT